jgi:hypothetical protein
MQLLKAIPFRKITGNYLILVSLLLLSFSVFSQESIVEENSEKIQVKYLEGDNDALHFNLRYNNNSGYYFKLMVLNESGEVLFQKNYSGRNFRKKIKLARLTDADDLTFLIRSPKETAQLSYTIKVPNKVIDASTGSAN